MDLKKDETKEIEYETFIVGALLKFNMIDNFDFSLLARDFIKECDIKYTGLWYESPNQFGKYIETLQNGTIRLKTGFSLDTFIKKENQTLREKFLEIAGDTVNNYFNNLDMVKYKQKKEVYFLEKKDNVLKNANVLLISDVQDDYDELIKYGFKNINYFKSIIRAIQYFKKYPEEIDNYHIIIKGNQKAQRYCFECKFELDTEFKRLVRERIPVFSLYRYDYGDYFKLSSFMTDNYNHRSWDVLEYDYTRFYDRLLENILINHLLEKIDSKDFHLIKDYINPNRILLPTKKSDLKILYLNGLCIVDYTQRVASELGLSIDFRNDNNYSLEKHVIKNLGNYDIIIVNSRYSGNIINMNFESTEQCKDTGRDLTLLVSQEEIYYDVDRDLANGIYFEYVFGGNYAPDYGKYSDYVKVLRQPIEVNEQKEYWKENCQSNYSTMKGIIESVVSIYNQILLDNKQSGIKDLNFKSVEKFNQEYDTAYENKIKVREFHLSQINSFDNICNTVSTYLNYRRKGLVFHNPEGLIIMEDEKHIKVENIYNGRVFCTLRFLKDYKKDDYRVFHMETLSKKGYLSSQETVGLYTSNYENMKGIPDRPNEKQMDALNSINKKIDFSLKPVIDDIEKTICDDRNNRSYKKRKYN